MTLFLLASLGGLIALLSTSAGALSCLFLQAEARSPRFSLSVDFALGLMVSASAFSLIGPAAWEAAIHGAALRPVLGAAAAGLLFVFFLRGRVRQLEALRGMKFSHLLLATVLMLHNFPEGMAGGAAFAGLPWNLAAPILGGISLQNVPEGALMVMCLRSFGWSPRLAVLGGIGSGLFEMLGGTLAGAVLLQTQAALPALLSFAGGAMMAGVLVELLESEERPARRLTSAQFAAGMAVIPLLQLATS